MLHNNRKDKNAQFCFHKTAFSLNTGTVNFSKKGSEDLFDTTSLFFGMSSWIIRRVKDPSEYWEIMDVMKDAWGMDDYTEAVPAHLLKAIDDNGGVLRVAEADGRIVGFVLGFPALKPDGSLYHYSHMVGVRRAYRGRGIALALKLAQREVVLAQGLDLIEWTYDPAQGLNAKFNFAKLGVVCRRYYPNYYGEMRDSINRGMISDRFKVEWWVKSERVKKRVNGELLPPSLEDVRGIADSVFKTVVVNGCIRRVEKVKLDLDSEVLLVEIPGDINEMKRYSLDLANEWKLKLRSVFQEYFSRGYVAVDFISVKVNGCRRNFYVLWKAPLEKILRGEVPWK